MPDIHFACQKCNQTINAPGELANQLIECPTCKETIEVPVRTRAQPPNPTSSVASASGNESIFFQNGDIMVTNARFVVGAKTFAMRGITSVEVVESDEAIERESGNKLLGNTLSQAIGWAGFIIIVVGVLLWFLFDFSYWVSIISGIIGVVMIIIAASLTKQWKRFFKIVMKTAGGEVTAYGSFDRDHVSKIVRALNDSIISHG